MVFLHDEHLTLDGAAEGTRPAGPAEGAPARPRAGAAAGASRVAGGKGGGGDGAGAAAPAVGPAQLGQRQESPG